jgi:acyl-CoA reductase-like NAD-dependent aldehyde dehydrogenase
VTNNIRAAQEEIFGPAGAPSGGRKKSGIGRETRTVIPERYIRMKNIMINLTEAPPGFYPG